MGGEAREAAAPEGVEFTAGGLALVPPYAPLRSLTRWTAGGLAATAALSALSLGVEISRLRLLLRPAEGDAALLLARAAQEATGGLLAGLRLLVFGAALALLLGWLFQARTNVRALGVRRPRFASRWAVAAFLVPGLNLVRPHAVVAEVWRASDPATLDPFAWQGVRVPRLVRVWWAGCIVWALLAVLAATASATAGVVLWRLRLAAALGALADLGACLAAAATWLLVLRLGELQAAKWQRARAGRANAVL